MRFRLLKKNFIVFLVIFVVFVMLFYSIRRTRDEANVDVTEKDGTQIAVMDKFEFGSTQNMRKSIIDSNYRQIIQNGDKFPSEPEAVVVVQVHNRPAYLKMLIQSLEKVVGVQNTLLIFSHDYFSEEISNMVKGITFCRVLQIYFPYSIQLYPDEFPGQDPRDCPRDISKEDAIKKRCLNAEHPDSYGHYREASITQTKHHWWWKLHFVFERVQVLRGYNGYVVFIEEDNYLLPDFHKYLKSMIEVKKTKCGDCDVLALGNHNGLSGFHELSGQTETAGWLSTKHNIGMGISRELYYKLMGCNNAFCTYDDYNWDWTLQNLSGTCVSKPLKVLVARGSRVLHTGDCGLHQKEDCRPEMAQEKVDAALKEAHSALFPSILTVTDFGPVVHQPHMKNGGWGDVRDHTLCINYAARL